MGLAGESGRIKRIGLPRPRRAAAELDHGLGGLVRQHHGDAAQEPGILGIADSKAGDIGDQVESSRTCTAHVSILPWHLLRRRSLANRPGRGLSSRRLRPVSRTRP